jgi:hypothetical protein
MKPIAPDYDYGGDPALDLPRYSRAEVPDLCGISDGRLKGILDRGYVMLSVDHNPGSGKHRIFTGGDVLQITGAARASEIGVPMRSAGAFAKILYDTAVAVLNYPGRATGLGIALYPDTDGEWRMNSFTDAEPLDGTQLPCAYNVISVSKLIQEVFSKIDTSLPAPGSEQAPPPPTIGIPNPFHKGRGRRTAPHSSDVEIRDASESVGANKSDEH